MNYSMKTVNDPRSLACTLRCGANLTPEFEGACGEEESSLLPDSVVYGVCLMLRKSTYIRDALIPMSYFYRFPHKTRPGSPKIPRSQTVTVKIPGGFLCLPGRTVLVRLLVAGDGITITHIEVKHPSTSSHNPWEKVVILKTK